MDISCSGSPKRKLQWFFRMYDTNNSGILEESEMTRVLTSIFEMRGQGPKKTRKSAKRIFQKIDKDKNGQISEEEFIRCCLTNREIYHVLTNEVTQK